MVIASAVFAQTPQIEYIQSPEVISEKLHLITTSDSIALISVDSKCTTPELRFKNDKSIHHCDTVKKIHGTPTLEYVVVKDSLTKSWILKSVTDSFDVKNRGMAACYSWVGTMLIFNKSTITKLRFDDANGNISFEDSKYHYSVDGSINVWGRIMTRILRYKSLAKGPCHSDDDVACAN